MTRAPARHRLHRREHIVENRFGWERPPELAPQRIDGSGRSNRRADETLVAAQPLFVTPVGTDAAAHSRCRVAGFTIEEQFAGDAADTRIGQRRDERAQCVGRKRLSRVGKDEHVVTRHSGAGVERFRLAARRHQNRVDSRTVRREDCRRLVGRAVGDDDDLQRAGWIVQPQQVVDAPAQHRGLVSGRNNHRHRRRVLAALNRFWCDPRPGSEQRRVPGVDVQHDRERGPEHHCRHRHRFHAITVVPLPALRRRALPSTSSRCWRGAPEPGTTPRAGPEAEPSRR